MTLALTFSVRTQTISHIPSSLSLIAMNASLVGSGKETLVLSYGYGGNKSIWDAVVPQLSERHRLLLFDWNFSTMTNRCSFESFADELISLLDDMKLSGVTFVGHSMSGMIGCIASIKRPELFARLVLVAASPRYIYSEDYERGLDLSLIESIISNIQSNFYSWSESFAATVMPSDDPIPLKKFQASLKGMTQDAALALGKMVFYSDNRHLLHQIEVPCTIIQGSHDSIVPAVIAHYMQSKIKGKASVEIIEDFGHFPQLTSPAKFIDVVNT